ncbi:MAG: helix-turn-helix domain-containing protein [Blastocatellia bacterium]
MGRAKRPSPKRLGKKLRAIRTSLGLTQMEMAAELKRVARSTSVYPGHISEFELGDREPSLLLLLGYARLAGVTIDYLADDKAESRKSATD